MGSLLKIHSLYKVVNADNSFKYFLLQTEQPSYDNTSQGQADFAGNLESQKRQLLLQVILDHFAINTSTSVEFIGELQELPIGDKLYCEKGLFDTTIFYINTEYGYPWIIIGAADTEEEFMTAVED